MSMISPLPFTEQALRDTMIHRARGTALASLGQLYHMPKATILDEEPWREAMRAAVFGPRGTRGNLHGFLEAALAQFNTNYHCSIAPANPQRITWTSGGSDGGFTAVQVNRLFRVVYSRGSFLCKSIGPDFNAGPAVLGYLELCPISTGYWTAPNFTDVENISVDMLPFVWDDTGAVFYLWADMEQSIPPTYMQPQVRWAATQVLGWPALDYFPYPADAEDRTEWTELPANLLDSPLVSYTVTAETAGTWRNLIVNADIDTVPARGDSFVIRLQKKVVGVWVNTTLTCTLGAAATNTSDLVNSVVLAEGDEVLLRVTSGAAVTQPMLWPRMSVHIDRPGTQPNGGFVPENAWVNGDQTNGPWPIYLGMALDATFSQVLWSLLAAGVVLDGQVAAFNQVNGLT